MKDAQYWGFELVLDLGGGNRNVTNPDAIADFARDLVKRIDMIPHGEPQVFYFGEGHLAGWTLVQMITTSNITAHFNDDGTCYMNVFSCKNFDPATVKDVVSEWFGFTHVYGQLNIRDVHTKIANNQF